MLLTWELCCSIEIIHGLLDLPLPPKKMAACPEEKNSIGKWNTTQTCSPPNNLLLLVRTSNGKPRSSLAFRLLPDILLLLVGINDGNFQWLLSWLLHKWREGYLSPWWRLEHSVKTLACYFPSSSWYQITFSSCLLGVNEYFRNCKY